MPFIEPHRDLGKIKVGSEHTLIFKFSEDVVVSRVDTSCGCALIDDSTKGVNTEHEIPIKYKAKPIPPHLVKEGKISYPTAQQITVFYTTPEHKGISQQDTLTFKATVYK